MKKVLSILLVMVMLLAMGSNFVFAADDDDTTSISLDPAGIKGTYGDTAGGVQTIGKEVLGIIQIVGSVVAVIILVIIGIKYMMGSASEKAEYKKTLIPYIVGAVLIFAASNLASVVFKWSNSLGESLNTETEQTQTQDS